MPKRKLHVVPDLPKEPTQRARDKVCPACGGHAGAHTRLDCAYWVDAVKRQLPSKGGTH